MALAVTLESIASHIKARALVFFALARSKATTYVALATAGLTELVNGWDQAAALLPHWIIAHKAHIFAFASLVTVYTRIRREFHSSDKPRT